MVLDLATRLFSDTEIVQSDILRVTPPVTCPCSRSRHPVHGVPERSRLSNRRGPIPSSHAPKVRRGWLMKRHATSSELLVKRIEVIRREFDMNGTLLGRSACLCAFFERLIGGEKSNRAAVVTTDLDHGERRLGVVCHVEPQRPAVELNRLCDVGNRECEPF